MTNLLIPKSIVPIVEIEGREFIFIRERFQFQCAKCLNVMLVVPGPYDRRRTRALYIDPSCGCDTIASDDSGPIHAVTPKDLEDEKEKPFKDRIAHLTDDKL